MPVTPPAPGHRPSVGNSTPNLRKRRRETSDSPLVTTPAGDANDHTHQARPDVHPAHGDSRKGAASRALAPPAATESAPKRMRVLPPELASQPFPTARKAADIKAICAAIAVHSEDLDAVRPEVLAQLARNLGELAPLAHANVDGCAHDYQRALLYLCESGGRTDPHDAISKLHKHLYAASHHPSTLISFCRIAAEWLPSANKQVTRPLMGTLQALTLHPHLVVKQLAVPLRHLRHRKSQGR